MYSYKYILMLQFLSFAYVSSAILFVLADYTFCSISYISGISKGRKDARVW